MYIEHIIIGGGIAGCYIALQCLEKGYSFICFESKKQGEPWGKQITLKKDGTNIELGSSVIHSNQKNIVDMVQKLNLHAIPFEDEKNTKTWNKIPRSVSKPIKDKLKVFVQNNIEKSKQMTVEEMALLCLKKEEINLLKESWFNWFESKDEIAYTYYTSTEREGTYLQIKEGFQSVLTESQKRFPIYFNHTVIELIRDKDGYQVIVEVDKEIKKYKCKYCYYTIDFAHSSYIKLTNCPLLKSYLSLGISKASSRVYVCFKNPVKFYDKVDNKKIINIVGGVGHWSFKITDKIWMLSYVDGSEVEKVKYLCEENKCIKDWVSFIYDTFKVEGEIEIEEVIGAFWKHAFTLLKPAFFNKNIQPLEPNLICTTIPKPFNQAWSEGHLFNI